MTDESGSFEVEKQEEKEGMSYDDGVAGMVDMINSASCSWKPKSHNIIVVKLRCLA